MDDVNRINEGIPFHHLIGGPLKACISAQEQASISTWHYIQEVGLEKGKEAVVVSFSFLNNGVKAFLRVPLLSIVPIPYFSIDTLEISFTAKITKAQESLREDHRRFEFLATYTSDSQSNEQAQFNSTIDVAVRATQDHMPSGLSKILGFMEQAVNTEEVNLKLRDFSIARAIANGCVKEIPDPLTWKYNWGKKKERSVRFRLSHGNELNRDDIFYIKALNISHKEFPFFCIDDLGAFHSLLAFRCTDLELSQVQTFSMSRLADLHLLELVGTGLPLKAEQHCPLLDFTWLEQVSSLVLRNWSKGIIPKVILTSASELKRLEIEQCEHDIVDISYCTQLEQLKISKSKIKNLVVWNRFEQSKSTYNYDIPDNVNIIKR